MTEKVYVYWNEEECSLNENSQEVFREVERRGYITGYVNVGNEVHAIVVWGKYLRHVDISILKIKIVL